MGHFVVKVDQNNTFLVEISTKKFFSRVVHNLRFLTIVSKFPYDKNSMLYFVLGVLLAFTPGAALWGWLLTISAFLLFLASMLYTRWAKADAARSQGG